jgi:hypothetical protein
VLDLCRGVADLDLPAVLDVLPARPGDVGGVTGLEAGRDGRAEGVGRRVVDGGHTDATGGVEDERALGQHGALEAADVVDLDPEGGGDLGGVGTAADARLDVLR